MLNPLSPVNQCASDEAAKAVIQNVIDCFDHVDAILVHGRGLIYFDERSEDRSIGPVDPLGIAISKLVNTADSQLARKWFLYRKRLTRVEPPDCYVAMTSTDGACLDSVAGDVSEQIFGDGLACLSFGGGALTESKNLSFNAAAVARSIANHHCIASLKAAMPFYRASPKHRQKRYFDKNRREWVAPMTLPDDIAQQVLALGILCQGDYFGYHAASEKIVRFKQTLGMEYHGFEVELDELPNEVVEALFPNR